MAGKCEYEIDNALGIEKGKAMKREVDNGRSEWATGT